MGMQGNLSDMSVADLIQLNCQDRKTTQMLVRHADHEAELFFKDGQVVHAALDGKVGEEAVFQILAWNEGIFYLETGIEAPTATIARSWSSLLLEGARRLDESQLETKITPTVKKVNQMAQKLNDILKELSGEVSGYIASTVVGMDGLSIAEHSKSAKANPETISVQMALLLKLVDTSTAQMNSGAVEDNLLSTDNAHILMRFLPTKDYFLGIVVDRKTGNLGNLRLMSKLYAERVSKAMPR